MVVPSKIFEDPICSFHCSQSIIHPGIGCSRDFINSLFKNCVGGLKYFSPLLITPLVMKFKTMNNELFVTTLKYYLKTVGLCSVAASTSFGLICIFRNNRGRFHMYTTLFVPTVIGTQVFWLLPERMKKLFGTCTSQAVFEGLLHQYPNLITHQLLHSTTLQTLLFMLNSAIILHYKRLKVYREFWLMQPYATVEVNENVDKLDENSNYLGRNGNTLKKCVHDSKTCSEFVWDGIKSYLLYGIPMDALSALLHSSSSKRGPGILNKILSKVKAFRPNMTGFFILYSGIYRLSSCLLHKYYGHLSMDLQHILAAFLGGSAYLWMDKVSFFTLSTVIATQALWQQFCNRIESAQKSENSKKKPNLVLRLLKDVPFSSILICLNMGYLVHNFIMNYEVLNSFTRGLLDALTSNKTKNIRDMITRHTEKELTDIANSHAVRLLI